MRNSRPDERAARASMAWCRAPARVVILIAASVFALSVVSCDDRDSVRVQLDVRPPAPGEPHRLNVQAQVTGPQAGLKYRWLSVAGECDPQESPVPATSFRFGPGSTKDRVTVEVWRDERRVARSEVDVTLDERRAAGVNAASTPKVSIEITTIPPYNPEGGPDTRADIGGRVSGEISPEFQVVVYARADAWYNQPSLYIMHAIRSDNTWTTWTHTGSSYAALVVRPGFEPRARLDVLPQVGGYVLARTIVDGVPAPDPTTTAAAPPASTR